MVGSSLVDRRDPRVTLLRTAMRPGDVMRATALRCACLLLGLTGCGSDSNGPGFLDLRATVTWDRMNDAGFVADRWAILSREWGAEFPDTLAAGPIPGGTSPFVIEGRLACPIPNPPATLHVWGRYEGRPADTACHAVGWFDRSISACAIDDVTVTVGFTDGHPGFEQPTDGPGGVGCRATGA